MTKDNIEDLTKKFHGEISKNDVLRLEERLADADDSVADKICNSKIKSVRKTIIFSAVFGLFGGGSFYLRRIRRGICKCIFNVVLPLLWGVLIFYWYVPTYREYTEQTYVAYHYFVFSIDKDDVPDEYKYLPYDYVSPNDYDRLINYDNYKSTDALSTLSENLIVYKAFVDNFISINKICDFVENRININSTLTNISQSISSIIDNINGKTIENASAVIVLLKPIYKTMSLLKTDITDYYKGWWFDWHFANMMTISLLSPYCVIILAYWVGEVFRDAEKCKKYNYDIINASI